MKVLPSTFVGAIIAAMAIPPFLPASKKPDTETAQVSVSAAEAHEKFARKQSELAEKSERLRQEQELSVDDLIKLDQKKEEAFKVEAELSKARLTEARYKAEKDYLLALLARTQNSMNAIEHERETIKSGYTDELKRAEELVQEAEDQLASLKLIRDDALKLVQTKRTDLQGVRDRISEVRTTLTKLESGVVQMQNRITVTVREISDLEGTKADLESRRDELKQIIMERQNHIEGLKKDIEGLQAHLNSMHGGDGNPYWGHFHKRW